MAHPPTPSLSPGGLAGRRARLPLKPGLAAVALLALPLIAAETGGAAVRIELGPGTAVAVRMAELPRLVDGAPVVELEFRDTAGRLLQRLSYGYGYPLEAPEARPCFQDLDFDGHRDLTVLREQAGKHVLRAVWLYDPAAGRFVQGDLSRALEALPNLRVDGARRRLVASHVGPFRPWRRVYSVGGGQLRLEESCELSSDDRNYLEGTLVEQRPGEATSRRALSVRSLEELPCRDEVPAESQGVCLAGPPR